MFKLKLAANPSWYNARVIWMSYISHEFDS